MKPLETRQKDFKNLIWESVGKTCKVYPKLMLIEFFEHWSTVSDRGWKMAYEKEKTWNTKRRLATWKKLSDTNFGRFKKSKDMKKRFRNYFDRKLMRTLTPSEWQEYRTHLQTIGFVYHPGLNGQQSYLVDPQKEMIWL